MEKNRLKITGYIIKAGIGIIFCLFSACSREDASWNVLMGNMHFNKGDFAGATVSYMKALDQKFYPQWIHYNLGNTYSAMGEIDPAIQQLLQAREESDPELLYRTTFNLGEIHYELGDFEKAITYFKDSLKAKPKDLDAKINLEISIKNYLIKLDSSRTKAGNSRDSNTDQNWADTLKNLQTQEEKTWKVIKQGEPVPNAEDW